MRRDRMKFQTVIDPSLLPYPVVRRVDHGRVLYKWVVNKAKRTVDEHRLIDARRACILFTYYTGDGEPDYAYYESFSQPTQVTPTSLQELTTKMAEKLAESLNDIVSNNGEGWGYGNASV